MLTSNKDLKKLLQSATGRGWTFWKNGRHIRGAHTTGRKVSMSISPSDWRALKNIEQDLRIR